MAKNRFNTRRSGFLKPKKFFIVVTEGEKTEKLYLDEFKPSRDAVVQVKVFENKKHKTQPRDCLERLKGCEAKYHIGPEDELWLMIDRDSWEEAELNEVAKQIGLRANYFLALSNPCIELWFYLHLRDNKPFNHRRQLLPELEKMLGSYGKGNYDAARLAKEVNVAIMRAEKLDTPPQSPWPKTQGTHVYRLMKKILGR